MKFLLAIAVLVTIASVSATNLRQLGAKGPKIPKDPSCTPKDGDFFNLENGCTTDHPSPA